MSRATEKAPCRDFRVNLLRKVVPDPRFFEGVTILSLGRNIIYDQQDQDRMRHDSGQAQDLLCQDDCIFATYCVYPLSRSLGKSLHWDH